jgi:glycosyltransferase involved in cell wall biosynthesis
LKIGLAGPLSPELLDDRVLRRASSRNLYRFPLIALLANEYKSLGHEVVLFGLEFDLESPEVIRGESMTLALGGMRSRGRDRALDGFRQEREHLAALMAGSGCDVIHAHWTYEFALAALSVNPAAIVTCHDQPLRVLARYRHPYWVVRFAMATVVAHRASFMTAVAPAVATHLQRWLRHKHPIHVVPNGVPRWAFELFEHRPVPDVAKVRFATVLQGWSRLKNGSSAIQAFAEVRPRLPDAQLFMFGHDYEAGGPANRWARRNGIDDGISFIGVKPYRDLLSHLAREADVLVHPSLQEAMPMTVIEAMAIGLPVIGGSRSGGVPLVLPADAGVLVDVSDPGRLADAMEGLARHPETRLALAKHAHEHSLANFSIERVAEEYLKVYLLALND